MLVISSVEIPDTLDKSRIIEFSLLASNENIPTGVPDLATFKAITKERIVFQYLGVQILMINNLFANRLFRYLIRLIQF